MLRSGAPRPDAHTSSLVEDLRRISLAAGETPAGCPIILFPYGLNTAAQQYASSISTNMGAYEELPRHHLCSALNLVASTLVSEYQDSTETPGTGHHMIASYRYDPRD
jgi:hypothetical protein